MWRLLVVVAGLCLAWCASAILPNANDEEQLRSLTGIAASRAEASKDLTIGAINSKTLDADRPAQTADQMTPVDPTEVGLGEADLTNALQEQLRRVGCYKGPLDGKWTAATKRALARFGDHIMTKVSLERPMPAVLSLIRGYAERACGTPCPLGTLPDRQGSCMTTAVVAKITAAPIAPMPLAQKAPIVSVIESGAPAVPERPLITDEKHRLTEPAAIIVTIADRSPEERGALVTGIVREQSSAQSQSDGANTPTVPTGTIKSAALFRVAETEPPAASDSLLLPPPSLQTSLPSPSAALRSEFANATLIKRKHGSRTRSYRLRSGEALAWSTRRHLGSGASIITSYGFAGSVSSGNPPLSIVLSKR